MTDSRDTMRWVWRGIALAALVIGWLFITWQNHFHITAPVVVVCLAYLAVVATVYNLWRTGAAAVATTEDEGDSTWAKPVGALGELEREKRTLLKAIKEAEFDHQMGKLSKRDADDMIRVYRARAIEVIKDIDQLGLGAAGTPREQIMREVKARLELDAKAQKKTGADARRTADEGAKGKGKKVDPVSGRMRRLEQAIGAAAAAPQPTPGSAASDDAAMPPSEAAAEASRAADAGPASGTAAAVAPGEALAAATTNEAKAAGEPAARAAAATGAAALDDDAMDADSTTSVEPAHRAKEATR